jgi:dihydroorotase
MLLRGGRLVDPAAGIDALLDVRLRAGLVREIGPHLAPEPGEETLDAAGAVVAPGFVDMHVHLRDPGFPDKETLATGSRAAARGGFTAVACMPNTEPALDSVEILAGLLRRARDPEVACRIYPIAAMTRGRRGGETLDYAGLAAAGAVAFSDDGSPVADDAIMRAVALRARSTGRRLIAHAEDEDPMVRRDLALARETATAWHIAHVSTAVSAAAVAEARRTGVDVTCEVTPHHLVFTSELVRERGGGAKVNPPLRGEDDARALRDSVRRGEVDAFATDHAPHTAREKALPFERAAMGFTGLEVAVGAYAYALPDLPLARFVAMLSANPARILGVPGGTLTVGSPADVTVFADRPWTVRSEAFASKGRSTPFDGMRLPRAVVATIVAGSLRYRAEGPVSA